MATGSPPSVARACARGSEAYWWRRRPGTVCALELRLPCGFAEMREGLDRSRTPCAQAPTSRGLHMSDGDVRNLHFVCGRRAARPGARRSLAVGRWPLRWPRLARRAQTAKRTRARRVAGRGPLWRWPGRAGVLRVDGRCRTLEARQTPGTSRACQLFGIECALWRDVA